MRHRGGTPRSVTLSGEKMWIAPDIGAGELGTKTSSGLSTNSPITSAGRMAFPPRSTRGPSPAEAFASK